MYVLQFLVKARRYVQEARRSGFIDCSGPRSAVFSSHIVIYKRAWQAARAAQARQPAKQPGCQPAQCCACLLLALPLQWRPQSLPRRTLSQLTWKTSGNYLLVLTFLIDMTYESKKNAHLQRHLGASFIKLNELGKVSNYPD